MFIHVPGLVLSFYHATPMLYEISFRGYCMIETQYTALLLRVRVDGHLIIGSYLSSDMTNADGVDGAYMTSNGQTHGSTIQCSKTDWIYLSTDVHTIDVVTQTTGTASIDGGVLKIKLSQFDDGTDINMPIITPPKIKSI